MKLNLDALRKSITNDVVKTNNDSSDNGGYKLIYPFNEGKYKLRILYNPKAQIVQRRILRHATSDKKTKVPCLSVFGEDCPVCTAVKEVEAVKGKECGVYTKYGYKIRGICYAQLIDAPANVFKDSNVNRGDIVMFMYPKTIFNDITNIMVEAGEQLEEIVAQNLGHPIVVDVQSVNGKISYTAQVSLKKEQMCDTDEQFDALLDSLPNINEQFVPMNPNDEMRNSAKALADAIKSEYLDSTVVDPGDVPNIVYGEEVKTIQADTVPVNPSNPFNIIDDDLPFEVKDTVTEIVEENPVATVSANTESLPECFGCYKSGDKKCMLCIKEVECMKATK